MSVQLTSSSKKSSAFWKCLDLSSIFISRPFWSSALQQCLGSCSGILHFILGKIAGGPTFIKLIIFWWFYIIRMSSLWGCFTVWSQLFLEHFHCCTSCWEVLSVSFPTEVGIIVEIQPRKYLKAMFLSTSSVSSLSLICLFSWCCHSQLALGKMGLSQTQVLHFSVWD